MLIGLPSMLVMARSGACWFSKASPWAAGLFCCGVADCTSKLFMVARPACSLNLADALLTRLSTVVISIVFLALSRAKQISAGSGEVFAMAIISSFMPFSSFKPCARSTASELSAGFTLATASIWPDSSCNVESRWR